MEIKTSANIVARNYETSTIYKILCFFSNFCSAQTKLTFFLSGNVQTIDTIKIYKFSSNRSLTNAFKNGSAVSFQDKFADLYTIEFFEKTNLLLRYQSWIDTGRIKIVIKNTKLNALSIDTVIGSALTYKSQKFLSDLGDYRQRKDSSNINNLMIDTYKENLGNPFSFYVGEFYYNYNKQNYFSFSKLNSFERHQNKIIKNSVFYSMMLAKRFRYSESLFVNFFTKESFINIKDKTTSKLIDKNKFNIILFLDSMTSQSITTLRDFENDAFKFNSKDFNITIAINQKHYKFWEPLSNKSKIGKVFTVDGNSFLKETLFYPDTKCYVLTGDKRIDGYYDTSKEVLKHFDKNK